MRSLTMMFRALALCVAVVLAFVCLSAVIHGCSGAQGRATLVRPVRYSSERFGECVAAGVQTRGVEVTGHACARVLAAGGAQ